MNSVYAYLLILLILTGSIGVWYSRINLPSTSLRLLSTLIVVPTQVLIEIYLTFYKSPLRLSQIPIFHSVTLLIVYFSSRNNRTKVKALVKFPKSLKRKATPSLDLRNKIAQSTILFAFVLLIGIGLYPALLGGPSTVDERSYHWPQVLAIVQNNGFTSFDSSLPWTYAYPLGQAATSAFTWPFVHTDLAFRSVQLLFGIIALLSIYVLGLNFSRLTGIMSALILAASPIFSVMLRMLSDDLAYGAFALASVTFLIEACKDKSEVHRERLYLFGLLAFGLSGQFKYPVISTILILPLALRYVFISKQTKVNVIKNFSLMTLACFASYSYAIRNYLLYKNPFFPLSVQIGGKHLFSGPEININNTTINPSTTINITAPFRLLKIWYATFFDFFQAPNEASLGSYNYIIGLLLIVTLFFAIIQIHKLSTSLKVILCSSLLIIFAVPGIFVPRYGFFVIFIVVVFSVNAFSPLLSSNKSITIFACLILLGISPILLQDYATKNWIYSQSGGQNVFKNGQSYIDRKINLASDGSVLPATMVDWIDSKVKRNDTVCYAAATNFPSFYWNKDRTSKVRYLPILKTDRYPNNNNRSETYSKQDIQLWLNEGKQCTYLISYDLQSQAGGLLVDWNTILHDPITHISILGRVK